MALFVTGKHFLNNTKAIIYGGTNITKIQTQCTVQERTSIIYYARFALSLCVCVCVCVWTIERVDSAKIIGSHASQDNENSQMRASNAGNIKANLSAQ